MFFGMLAEKQEMFLGLIQPIQFCAVYTDLKNTIVFMANSRNKKKKKKNKKKKKKKKKKDEHFFNPITSVDICITGWCYGYV